MLLLQYVAQSFEQVSISCLFMLKKCQVIQGIGWGLLFNMWHAGTAISNYCFFIVEYTCTAISNYCFFIVVYTCTAIFRLLLLHYVAHLQSNFQAIVSSLCSTPAKQLSGYCCFIVWRTCIAILHFCCFITWHICIAIFRLLLMPFLQNVEILSAGHLFAFFKTQLVGDILETFYLLQKTRNR